MARGWMLLLVGFGAWLAAGAAPHQAAGQSLSQRLGFSDPPRASQQQVMRDPQVRPAAVAAREQSMNATKRRGGGASGGSFLSRFKLPSLLPGGSHDSEALSDPPAAYDPAELQSPRTGAAAPAARQPARRQAASAATPQQRTAPAPQRGAAAQQRAVAAPARTAGPPTNRVARSSPSTANRHNELADALTGLQNGNAQSATPEADAAAGDVEPAPPAAAVGEEAPSYLADEAAPQSANGAAPSRAAAPRAAGPATAVRSAPRGPVDVRDALLDAAVAPPVGSTAPAPLPPRRAASPAPTAAPTAARRTAVAAAPARRSPAPADDDLADSLRDSPSPAVANPPAAVALSEPAADNTSVPAAPAPAAVSRGTTIAAPTAPAAAANLRPRGDALSTWRAPAIASSVFGPQRVVVGRTAEYRVVVENRGAEPAHEMVATVTIPGGAELLDAAASNGEVEQTAAANQTQSHTVRWQLYRLAAGETQTLALKLVPRSGQAFELGVQCEQAPTTSQATVEVQEPRLQMSITGPGEVLFGKSQRYTLTLSNPGTGDAEDVLIELTPPGGDPKAPVKHKIGALAAGASKSIELELTAREAGDLQMLAAAVGAGDLRAEAVKTVICRKAELDVDWRGPDKNFAGAVATYFIRLRNPGTAAAEKVAVELCLPPGAELVDASAGHSWDASRRMVVWTPGALAPSDERFMQMRCRLTNPGVNQLELVARTAAGDLSDVHSVPVTIEALADLKLHVSDPQGVLPVGETAVYEIRVQNRGLTSARGVNVVAMFSEGIDPSHVEGGQHEIRDGRVSFRTIESLPAGAEVVLKIHAKATQAGTHIFRTEVVCDDLDTKLAAEETTRYFVEEERWADASAAYSDTGAATTR